MPKPNKKGKKKIKKLAKPVQEEDDSDPEMPSDEEVVKGERTRYIKGKQDIKKKDNSQLIDSNKETNEESIYFMAQLSVWCY